MRNYHLIAASLIMFAAHPLFAEDTYSIKIDRPQAVGQLTDIKTTSEFTRIATVTLVDKPAQKQEQSFKIAFEYRESVESVDSKGNPTALTITIKKATDDKNKNLIESGKVIQVKRTSRESIFSTKDGDALSGDAKTALSMIYPPIVAFTQDDTYGSATPRKIGESWPVNAENAAKEVSAGGATVDPKDISGDTTIKAIEDTPNGKALRIHGHLDAKPTKSDLPPSVTLEKSTMSVTVDGLFSVDTSLPPAQIDITSDLNLTMSGNERRVESKTHTAIHMTTTSVAK